MNRGTQIPNWAEVNWSQRPAAIPKRRSADDLISGTKNSHFVTLLERYSRFTTLINVPSKETTVAVAALSRTFANAPRPSADRWRGTGDTRWPNTRPSASSSNRPWCCAWNLGRVLGFVCLFRWIGSARTVCKSYL